MKKRSLGMAVLVCALWQAGLTAATGAAGVTVQEGATTKVKSQPTESPFFCNLSALDAEQRKHHRESTQRLRESIEEIRELPDGYAFRFAAAADRIRLVADWVTLERLCCPFFAFRLDVGSDNQPLWLHLTGREGVKAFMRLEFDLKEK